ncbi:pyrroline-5-carboxylate reductase [Legionella waltersii]|uniref:Pyrroline-5-carboxylate reductase n=1 Tax=Legionella waltersii TaxID=66969 RepID=A0A0W1AN52_9GAMM|nr:pyrroline-5-carboxylate reductase [Legionella waltersii]KTD82611.1 pyrroline-5-carboxylate reductase [Legionella waltersii]SNV07868.1 pyrroline-5-carboxylate reductase [Legionella waltersii]
MKIGFIGYGNMAKAMARSMKKLHKYTLMASAPSLVSGINKDNIQTFNDNAQLAKFADVIILAVKPAHMKTVVQEITPFLKQNALIISIAAGISLHWLANHFNKEQAIIRCMPNTPASIGMAATPMIANNAVQQAQKQVAEELLSTIGITTWASTEDEIDTFTAFSGSGPAYVFLFLESLVHAAVELGLSPQIAKAFALQTCLGSTQLALQSSLELNQLRNKVTSPGGTTAAALAHLENHLTELIMNAMRAAKQRAHELGESS